MSKAKKGFSFFLLAIFFLFALYLLVETACSRTIRSALWVMMLNWLLFFPLLLLKKERLQRAMDCPLVNFQGPLFFFVSILSASFLFRCALFFKEANHSFPFSFLFADWYVCRIFFPPLLCFQCYGLVKCWFHLPFSKKRTMVGFFFFSSILLFLFAFLFGWGSSLGRFPGLEIIYLIQKKDVKYDFWPLFIALIFPVCLYFFCRFFSRHAFFVRNKNRWTGLIPVVFFPALFLFSFPFFNSRQIYYIDLIEGDGYASNYNAFLKKNKFWLNPLQSIFEYSVGEFYRVKNIDSSKKFFPFFQRPSFLFRENERRERIAAMLHGDEEVPLLDYPAYRIKKEGETKPYNVVVLVLETFEHSSSDSFKGRDNPLPFFEELKQQSLYCHHAFSNAQASYEGESAVSSSLPIWGIVNAKDSGIITTSYHRSYLNLLKERGYVSEFSKTWEGLAPNRITSLREKLGSFLLRKDLSLLSKLDYYCYPFVCAGIERVSPLFDASFSEDQIDKNIHFGEDQSLVKKMEAGIGRFIHDDDAYEKLFHKMTSSSSPFFLVTHTESSHTGFPIPHGHRPDHALTGEERFYYSIKYADSALRRFFEKAKNHPVFDDTIFVLVSDHTSRGEQLSLYDQYHINLLFYAPKIITPQVIDDPAFQIDVGPTLLNLLGIGGQYTTFGKNVNCNPCVKKRGMILPDWEGYLIFVCDPYIAKVDVDRVYEMYNFRQDKYRNLVNESSYKQELEELHREFHLLYQMMGDSMYANKIYPESLVD